MGSSSKSGSASKQYNVHGSLAGLITDGVLHSLHAILLDGKEVWTGPLTRATAETAPGYPGYSDLTGSIDAKYFAPGGYLRLYWGTETQPINEFLQANGHPRYKGRAYFVAVGMLFGKERYTAPEIKFIASAVPAADESLIPADDNYLDDGQISPVAAISELLTSPSLLGLALDRLVLPTFIDCLQTLNGGPIGEAHRERILSQCSPLVTSQEEAKNILADLAAMGDIALRWRADGKLECKLIKWGELPEEITTLDARHWIDGAPPKVGGDGLDAVPTSAVVAFTDRDKKYKSEVPEIVPNLHATTQRGDTNPLKLSRPHVTRRAQSNLIGTEAIRQNDQPRAPVEVSVRSPCAVNPDGSPLLPGDKVLIDLDPEPGGEGSAQLCVVIERSFSRTGPVKLKLLTDTLSAAKPYSPALANLSPQEITAEPLVNALAVPLPPSGADPVAVAILATRPDMFTTAARVTFSGESDFSNATELGTLTGFAARLNFPAAGALTATANSATLVLTDGANGPDAQLGTLTPESEAGAVANALLLVIASVVDGRVVVDGEGKPVVEFCSIITRAAVSADTHTYSIIRGRLGLPARAWTDSAKVWLLPLVNLRRWTHPSMAQLLRDGEPAYFSLLASTAFVVAEDVLEISTDFPATYDVVPRLVWSAPVGGEGYVTNTDGEISITLTASDPQADLVAIRVETRRRNGAAWANQTVQLDVTMPPTGNDERTLDLVLPGDTTAWWSYQIIVTLRDATGFITQQTRDISREPTGTPITPPSPYLFPAANSTIYGSAPLYSPVDPAVVFIYRASGTPTTNYIEFLWVPPGAPPPADGEAEIQDASVGYVAAPAYEDYSTRLYTRARTAAVGGEVSEWVMADYNIYFYYPDY